jgi:NAD(P)-dependent dehydrogenase (short-subunit alcohol dehydrogenase family)
VGRRVKPLERVAAETGAFALDADVTDPAEVGGVVERTVERFGGLDVVVNNAGGGGGDWNRAFAVNATAPRLLAEAAFPHLAERGGSVVNVASVAGIVAHAGGAAYSASKAALIMLTRTLAVEWGPRGVRVNVVCPAWIRTPMGDRGMTRLADRRGTSVDEAYELVSRAYPLRRVGEPEEVAAVCLFLASREASFITGATVVVDGGATVVDVGQLPFADD